MNAEPVIEIVDINKSFGDNHVLRDFTMNLYKGENLVVLGKSGSGKSVLIKCIIGLLTPDSGSIKVFGEDISEYDRRELDRMRVKVGFLFQSNALYDSMTVRENLEFPLRRHHIKGKQDAEEVEVMVMEALGNVGLEHTVDMMPAELSGGMRKRIALARTLILRPEIILYDEPTTGLDPITGREISELIVEVQKKYNASSIIISHDINCISITSNRVVMLIDGRCYAEGTYQELSGSEDPKVREFFK
ncbi:Methionine ABC transporter ATP-binding protein [Fulvivirga imtechensis AK7]|uniref:Methionine ABC transporter ATP-binding protein n=1 Tax=Fulvivirga imtechensis AK7 TaxID=1237149 RepID=L8JMK2_9BACT|nr:ATP-binding cassette domain-containing protein [Fulvivirga imtechensis]ELR70146.1 Methionine ABC transporter ATP-binding protein [Fulvivirga imtechensis AK7]